MVEVGIGSGLLTFEGDIMQKLIGLSGFCFSGKDWMAQRLIAADSSFKRFALADSLKEVCAEAFDLPLEYFHDVKLKNTQFDEPIQCNLFHSDLEASTDLNIPKSLTRDLVFNTPRELLQQVGTNVVRAVEDNYWLLRAKLAIQTCESNVVVTDVRFLNEFHMIKSLGGTMIRIHRPSQVQPKVMHISETELMNKDHDSMVYNIEDNQMPMRDLVRDIITGSVLKAIY